MTALILAGAGGQLKMVQELFKHPKIDVNIKKGVDCKTALISAVEVGHTRGARAFKPP